MRVLLPDSGGIDGYGDVYLFCAVASLAAVVAGLLLSPAGERASASSPSVSVPASEGSI